MNVCKNEQPRKSSQLVLNAKTLSESSEVSLEQLNILKLKTGGDMQRRDAGKDLCNPVKVQSKVYDFYDTTKPQV